MLTKFKYSEYMDHLRSIPAVALVTTGRTGSDFLQSLIDTHPEILTFNGHILLYTEFFNKAISFSGVFQRVQDMADEFIGTYLYKLVSDYDYQEAKDKLGDKFDKSIRIDTVEYKHHLICLMDGCELNTRNFLLAIYGAYGLCLKQDILNCRVLFHHPHQGYELEFFLRDFPNARAVFSSRDPRANFCSNVEHFRRHSKLHDNQQHVYACLKIILEGSELGHKLGLDYISTRLEDLPREDIMQSFASWLGVTYVNSMLRSTWAGLDWHGDRVSAKVFASIGWSPTRTENGWERRLGGLDKYLLKCLLAFRLYEGGYAMYRMSLIDFILIPFVICIPMKYERRFWTPKFIYEQVASKQRAQVANLVMTPFYYYLRVRICFKYYLRILKKDFISSNYLTKDFLGKQ